MLDPGWFVYMLRCVDNTLYTGITNDLERRCWEHNAGTASCYTRSRLPRGPGRSRAAGHGSLAPRREAVLKALPRAKQARPSQ